ncbi:hypothetical protein GH733_015162, partial [Mirounga leonina]
MVFDQPKHEKELLAHTEDILENQLDPEFQKQSIISVLISLPMQGLGPSGKKSREKWVCVTYVDAISHGTVPCLENSVTTLTQCEISVAMQKAADHRASRWPSDLRNLLRIFLISQAKSAVISPLNKEASVKYCQAKLDQLSKALRESISAGTFSVPGGHKLYRQAKERTEWKYLQVPRKGTE